MLKLYGSTMSRAHRVMWMLKELEVPFEHIPTNFLDGSTRHPDFLKVNPNGRVPVIDDDGIVLFESMAINLYLANKYPTAISPADPVEDAVATQWSFWVVTEIEKPLLLAAANSFLFEAALRNEDERQLALRKLDRPWTVLEKSLSRSPFLMSGRFTVADLNVAAVMDLIPTSGISLDKYPLMRAWLQRCLERPAANDWQTVKFTIPRPPTSLGVLGMFV
jgi:glutathione S-transferase